MEETHRITEDVLVRGIADISGLCPEDTSLETLKSRIKISDFEVVGGAVKGSNFACEVKGITVKAKVDENDETTFKLFAKCVPFQPMREKWVKDAGIMKSEHMIYSKLIPEMEKLVQKAGLDLCVPQAYYTREEDQMILMEDLRTKGYRMWPKTEGLALDHIKLVLHELAKYHAASFHYVSTYPGGVDALKAAYGETFFRKTWVPMNDGDATKQFETSLRSMAEAAAGVIQKKNPDLSALLFKFVPQFVPTMNQTLQMAEGPKIFIHGDCWNNNFMFKYDEANKVNAVKICDLQVVRYAEPSHDLTYFFYTSVHPATRRDHMEELLRYYHQHFSRFLVQFGYSADTWPFDKFKKDFHASFPLGFTTGIFVTQIMVSEQFSPGEMASFDMDKIKDEADMQKMMEEFKAKLGSEVDNQELVERIEALVQEAKDRGLLS